MLEDRDYMRQPEGSGGWLPAFRWRWSWTVILLAVYVVVFLAELLVQHFVPNNDFFHGRLAVVNGNPEFLPGFLPLSLEGLRHGYVWQLISYQFLHAGWLHLLLNGWAIFMFGRELELLLGGRRFLTLMLTSGVIGGVFQVLVAFVWPQYFGTHLANGVLFSGETVGASACAFGLVAAFAAMFPERELTMLLFFVIPIHLRAKMLLVILGVVALAGFGLHFDNVAHAAHLGGMAMGWFYVRYFLPAGWSTLTGPLRPAEWMSPSRGRPEEPEEPSHAEFMESEVNPILEKISSYGIQSLTAREREILEKARKKMRRD